MKIYLAGGMKDGWQDRAMNLLEGHEFLDPRSWSTTDAADYTNRDLGAIRVADCVLVHMSPSNPSGYGLSVEVGYAFALGKPIIFCDELRNDWRSKYFDMHRMMASTVCFSLEEVAEGLMKRLSSPTNTAGL